MKIVDGIFKTSVIFLIGSSIYLGGDFLFKSGIFLKNYETWKVDKVKKK
jgi:hypothetical protein